MSQPQQMTIQEALELAIQHHRAGQLAEACSIYQQVLTAQPNQADALHLAGVAAHQGGHHEQAIALIGRAVEIQPDVADFYFNLGLVFTSANRHAEAAATFRKVLELSPQSTEANFYLGLAYRRMGKVDEAIDAFRAMTQQRPEVPEAWNNLGDSLEVSGQVDQAIDAFRQAIQLRPEFAEAHNNLGHALSEIGQFDQAMVSLDEATKLRPDYPAVQFNRGVIHLLRGDFAHGWAEYEARLAAPENPAFGKKFTQPEWRGPSEDISNKTILLHPEQGLGDAIQFVRYITMVKTLGAKIILQCEPDLLALFKQLKDVDALVAIGQPLPAYDLHCPLMSLPLRFGTTLESIPAQIPYLRADPTKSARWKKRLAQTSGRKIGLAWAGRPLHPRDRARSLNLAALAPLAQVRHANFFSLQKGKGAEEAANPPAGMSLTDWTNDLGDLDDTAALIDNLDLVITVDTSIAHLAGAMGKPVWVLLPFAPDWRWMLDRNDSPWYPTLKLFRQSIRGDWKGLIEQIAKSLDDRS